MPELNHAYQRPGTELVCRIRDYGVHPSYIRVLDDVDVDVDVDLAVQCDTLLQTPVDFRRPRYDMVISRWEPSISQPLDRRTLSQFLHDASGRGAPTEADFLSSTEIHVICRAVPGISDGGFAGHYIRFNHSLELRADIDGLDEFFDFQPSVVDTRGTFIVCLSSAFNQRSQPGRAVDMRRRGAQVFSFPLDVMERVRERNREIGHAVASLAFAAAALGWEVRLLDASLGFEALKRLTGLRTKRALENEVPVAALVVFPTSLVYSCRWHYFPPADSTTIDINEWRSRILLCFDNSIQWRGSPDSVHADEHVSEAFARALAVAEEDYHPQEMDVSREATGVMVDEALFCYRGCHTLRRALMSSRVAGRSAADFDPLPVDICRFWQLLCRCWTQSESDPRFPHSALPWAPYPRVDMYVVINRVMDLESGLYCLLRSIPPHPLVPPEDVDLWTPVEGPSANDDEAPVPFFHIGRDINYEGAPSFELLDRSAFFMLMVGYYPANLKDGYVILRMPLWEAGFLGELLRIDAAAQDLSACEIPIAGKHDFWENVLGLGVEFQVLSLYAFGDNITIDD